MVINLLYYENVMVDILHFIFSQVDSNQRQDVLHNIDPLFPKVGKQLYNDTFDTRTRASLRSFDWKIITGDPGIRWYPVTNLSTTTLTLTYIKQICSRQTLYIAKNTENLS